MSKFVWAKKVPRELIRRLYESDAAAIPDEELADEVGWALYARCDAIVNVTECYELGRLRCPECGRELTLTDEHFSCGCGFGADWDEFRRSYRAKQLYGAERSALFQAISVRISTRRELWREADRDRYADPLVPRSALLPARRHIARPV